jgi:hypothetical protein
VAYREDPRPSLKPSTKPGQLQACERRIAPLVSELFYLPIERRRSDLGADLEAALHVGELVGSEIGRAASWLIGGHLFGFEISGNRPPVEAELPGEC